MDLIAGHQAIARIDSSDGIGLSASAGGKSKAQDGDANFMHGAPQTEKEPPTRRLPVAYSVFHDIGARQTEQHDAAVVAQLFDCRLVVWWRTSSLLTGLVCEVVPGRGSRLLLVPAN